MSSPLLWYLNRATGAVLLVAFSLTVVLGILATGRRFSPLWPRFVTQGLHRALAGVTLALLAAHVASAVIDEYVDIRWWQAVVPFGATYRPLFLGLGAVALDLLVVVGVTSLLRRHIPHRVWRAVHLSSYLAWAVSVVHGLGIGTDSAKLWSLALTAVCVGAVIASAAARLVVVARRLRTAPAGLPAASKAVA